MPKPSLTWNRHDCLLFDYISLKALPALLGNWCISYCWYPNWWLWVGQALAYNYGCLVVVYLIMIISFLHVIVITWLILRNRWLLDLRSAHKLLLILIKPTSIWRSRRNPGCHWIKMSLIPWSSSILQIEVTALLARWAGWVTWVFLLVSLLLTLLIRIE